MNFTFLILFFIMWILLDHASMLISLLFLLNYFNITSFILFEIDCN